MFFSGVYVLAEKPWVIAVADNTLVSAAKHANTVGARPHFLVFRTWYGGDLRGGLSALRLWARAGFPRVTWMCNALAEVRMLRALGQAAIFCHHNLFCNEQVFTIGSNSVDYDAIYIARLDSYKRLWLAKDIPRLRLVTANPQDAHRLEAWKCGHAVINQQFMEYPMIAAEISRAKCGLALSRKEGGMLATTEYLLCGKPVLSTPSRGGREYWLDESNSLKVAASSQEIGEAVRGLQSSAWNPQLIRHHTISRIWGQRQILFDYVGRLAEGRRCTSSAQMDADWLYHQFVKEKDIPRLLGKG